MSSRVLLVGPNPQELVPYAVVLAQHGYAVRSASTGLGCLDILRDWRPNLLVMNPDFNWGSGIGVLGVMNEDPTCPSVPIVLMVDDVVRMRAELLAVEKNAKGSKAASHSPRDRHILRQPVPPDELCKLADELLLHPNHLHDGASLALGAFSG